MQASYNPFEILNVPVLRRILHSRNRFMVMQRFSWPGIKAGRGFIATAYQHEKDAKIHLANLEQKEGKILDLTLEVSKINALIDNPGYYLFVNSFRDDSWRNNVLWHYNQKIKGHLSSKNNLEYSTITSFELDVNYGKLFLTVSIEGEESEFEMYEMIK